MWLFFWEVSEVNFGGGVLLIVVEVNLGGGGGIVIFVFILKEFIVLCVVILMFWYSCNYRCNKINERKYLLNYEWSVLWGRFFL